MTVDGQGAGDVEAQSGAEDGDGHTHYQHVTAVHAGDLHADRQQIANMMRELKHDNAGRTTKMNAAGAPGSSPLRWFWFAGREVVCRRSV